MNTFWDKIEEGLAGEFSLRALTPAFLFWGAGVVIWGFTHGWSKITDFLSKIEVTQGIILALAILLLLELSNWLGDLLKLPILQFLEGYWQWPLMWLRKLLTARVEENLRKKRTRLDQLALKEEDELTEEERKEFKKLELKVDRHPEEKEFLLPTRLGNLIQASELHPNRVYGLEILTVFPRLWLVLPENAQKEIGDAQEYLENQVKMIMLGVALFIWTSITWWIIPIAVVIIVWGYRRALSAGDVYGLMLRSTFDVYRFDLYQKLHLPLPDSPKEEFDFGVKLTQALARGFTGKNIQYRHPEK